MCRMSELNRDELDNINGGGTSLAERALKASARIEVRVEKTHIDEEYKYTGRIMCDREYSEFKKNHMRQRREKFIKEEGPFDRYDNVESIFKEWENKNFDYSLFSDPPAKTNPMTAPVPPPSRGTCGSSGPTNVPCRPSDRNRVVRAARELLGGRLLDRLSKRENEGCDAAKRLENQIYSMPILENKL